MKTFRPDPPQPTTIPNQFRCNVPSSIGRGGTDILAFPSGLQLMSIDRQLKDHTLFQYFFEKPSVGFGFCLDGSFQYQPSYFNQPFAIHAGEGGFFSFPKRIEVFEKGDDRTMQRVYLMLDGHHLSQLSCGDEDRFYPVLKSFEKNEPSRVGLPISPAIKAILYQIHHCPFHGMTRQLFLEGKALELLAHQLEQLDPNGGSRKICHKSSDDERARYAAQLLVNDLENPPDISTLSLSVGLNRNKLYRCFHRIFGVTPFEFLRNQRLQTAMMLLQDGQVNVTQAAFMVGYTNLSYFAKAFKSMFGVLPGELLRCSAASVEDLSP
nr:AraC family transcriptional regulator [uncultured Desulfobacter sp.]